MNHIRKLFEEQRDAAEEEIGPTSIGPNHFFKVIDVPLDGSEAPEVSYQSLGLGDVSIQLIPEHTSHAVRVILDGVPQKRDVERIQKYKGLYWSEGHSAIGYYDDSHAYPSCTDPFRIDYVPPFELRSEYWTGIRFSKPYFYPYLRSMFLPNTISEWYVVETFAWHECLGKNRTAVDAINVAFTAIQDTEGRMNLICYAPRANKGANVMEEWDPLNESEKPESDKETCSCAGWRWLALIEDRFRGNHRLKRDYDDCSLEIILEQLVFEILLITHKQNMHFLETVVYSVWYEPYVKPIAVDSRFALRTSDLLALRRSIDELNRALFWLADRMNSRLEDDSDSLSPKFDYFERLKQMLQSSQREVDHHISVMNELHNTGAQRNSSRQAENLARLTILTACFLPLSLAAAVLSMQTRFRDLHLLLYDLLGIAITFGVIAISIVLTTRKMMTMRLRRSYHFYSRVLNLRIEWMFALFVICTFLAISFLVGMFKDIRTGFIVLGYELASAVVIQMIGLVYLYFRDRKSSKPGSKKKQWGQYFHFFSWKTPNPR